MIDIYIDDVRVKTIGLSEKHNLILEAKSDKENKVQILLDDEELKTLYILSKNRCEVQGLIPVYNTISSTADVAEVRHGEWKIEEYKNHLNVVCSNCNKEFYVYNQGQYRIDRSNYCPNCGAKMEGERKDEE